MANNIAFRKNYTTILDDVYQRASVSHALNSGRRMVREGRNAKEIMIPKIEVTGLGDYTRNVGYKTGSIDFEYETKTFNYERGIRLMADVMDVEEAGLLDCFVLAGSELQRTQVAPEADAFTSSSGGKNRGAAQPRPGLYLVAIVGPQAPFGAGALPLVGGCFCPGLASLGRGRVARLLEERHELVEAQVIEAPRGGPAGCVRYHVALLANHVWPSNVAA